IFSIVVFATITAEGYINTQTESESKCMYNQNDSACSYAVGIGVLAFVACVIFLLLDAYFPQMSNAKDRRYIVFGDLGFSGKVAFTTVIHTYSLYLSAICYCHCQGLWTLLWFICFCVLASQWHQTETTAVPADAARAGIAFSFFSILSW
ncbi:hypothetical protein NL108_007372, partial [Boleophthalmus pectinirostris]